MTAWNVAVTEWLRLLRNRLGRLAILVSLFIPLLYSGLYLFAFWNPYGSLDRLPVALVNEDRGGFLKGKKQEIGKEIAKQLKEKIDLEWYEVDAKEAMQGVEGDRYYLVITIPSDFTERSLSITTSKPRQAKLYFTRNEGKNYITSQISNRIESEIRERIGNEYTQIYVQELLDLVGQSVQGISRAAEGAERLAKGANQLANGSVKLQQGIQKAAQGARQIEEGTKRLSSATDQLTAGANRLAQATQKLSQSVEQVSQKVTQAKKELALTEAERQRINRHFEELKSGISGIQFLNQQINQDLAQLQQATPEITSQSTFASLQKRQNDLTAEILRTKKRVEWLDSEVIPLLKSQNLNATQLVANIKKMDEGARRIADGLQQVHIGIGKLASSTHQLAQGLNAISAQMPNFVKGAHRLAKGNYELADKLNHALESQRAPSSELAPIIADPIDAIDRKLHQVGTYGTGLASYFLPLSLWVGALILYFAVPVNEHRWKLIPGHPAWAPIGKFIALLPIGVGQALLTGSVLHLGLGLPLELKLEFYLFLILIAWMSIAFIGFLIGTFGDGPGRVLAIVTLVFQLVSSSGTFPIELTPHFIQFIHPYLPMTYGVFGLREVIALRQIDQLQHASMMLMIFLVVPLLIWAFTQRRGFTLYDLKDHDRLESF